MGAAVVVGSALEYLSSSMDRLIRWVIILVVLEVGLVAFWIAFGSGRQRRSHFWVRVLLATLALPAWMAALVGDTRLHVLSLSDNAAKAVLPLLFFLGAIALLLVPGLLYRQSDQAPGPSESDDGGGPGPGRPRPSPAGPHGGVPLPDADQASARARDHLTPSFDGLKRRRPAHEPKREPAPTNR